MDHPWDRREGESTPAYQAAELYITLGMGRSIDVVARELNKSRTIIGRWSGRWDWVERAAAWDRHQSALARKGFDRAVVDQSKKWAKRADVYRAGLWLSFKLAVKFAERVEREARETGKDPSIALVGQAIDLVNTSKASAREAILGFPPAAGQAPDGSAPAPQSSPGAVKAALKAYFEAKLKATEGD